MSGKILHFFDKMIEEQHQKSLSVISVYTLMIILCASLLMHLSDNKHENSRL